MSQTKLHLRDKGPVSSAPGFTFEHYDSIGSTNSYGIELARQGHPGHLWLRAEEQTEGRGRRGRAWTSDRGNLFASVLLRFDKLDETAVQFPFVAALSLADAVEKACGVTHLVELKWPNDLLINGAKISGILLESESHSSYGFYLVCGFGVNVVHHPDLGLYKTTDLRSLGFQCNADLLFLKLAESFEHWLGTWSKPNGFDVVRKAWLERAIGVGEQIRVRLTREEFSGRFVDIDHFGRLILKMDSGETRLVSAGDVFFS
ncbi:biotin--[acetyl-CoA-carboxylase] ligase [Pseudovibrio sp. SPO723]|uniref:biotin--[acetyl-CoA-carboxylase] ligase n=1 Tax=Nesiotobacter zosterae TaxID=392721 RepID=UPI0029C104D2|nr:biotin--[acetyl-CoA-carboxylase] ligase [Pseudovibrio sp. SPO723]MDX5592719.1 biotin--[acetyl-CoA-carboxylase] ligase [Pseudovibrio sp. SPO723]